MQTEACDVIKQNLQFYPNSWNAMNSEPFLRWLFSFVLGAFFFS